FTAHNLAASESTPQTLILLIDNVNADFSVVSVVRAQIEHFLSKNGGRLPVPVGILVLTDTGMQMIAQPTTDGNMLASVLHQRDGELREIRRSAGFYGAEERTEDSLRGMSQLGRSLAPVPGRKLLVWIGPGWPIFDNPDVIITSQQQRQIFGGIVNFSGMLREAGVTVDSIDPLGPSDAGSPRSFLWESFTKPVLKPDQSNPGNLALQVFAVHTGGTVEVGSNDITGAIAKCAEDAENWYSITIDGQKADSPNTWHDLTVKVDRPKVKVRALNGYYAQP
ncbi:MAG: VWA domain-containing protein, partial [Acidobacteriota bacterium]